MTRDERLAAFRLIPGGKTEPRTLTAGIEPGDLINVQDYECLGCGHKWFAPKGGYCPKCYCENTRSTGDTRKVRHRRV